MQKSLSAVLAMSLSMSSLVAGCGQKDDRGLNQSQAFSVASPSANLNALGAQVKFLTSKEENAITSKKLADVFSDLEKTLDAMGDSSNPTVHALKKYLKDDRPQLEELMKTYPTIGHLMAAAKVSSIKDLNFSAWHSDLDAYPLGSMYPSTTTNRFDNPAFNLAPAGESSPACISVLVLGAGGFILGTFGEILSMGMGGPFGKHYLVSVGGGMMAVSATLFPRACI